MAIIDKVEITISSGGNVLQEYDVLSDDHLSVLNEDGSESTAPKVVKYIEAKPGAKFSINYSINDGQDLSTARYLGFRTDFDGQRMLSPCVSCEVYSLMGAFRATRKGSRTGSGAGWKESPYYWKELRSSKIPLLIRHAELKFGK